MSELSAYQKGKLALKKVGILGKFKNRSYTTSLTGESFYELMRRYEPEKY